MTSRLTDTAQVRFAEQVARADQELATLTRQYGELAADATLMGASMLPPPWGTAADVLSLGKSLASGDWGGALFDLVGFVPLIGDGIKGAGKGLKVVERMRALQNAIDAATVALARSKQVLGSARLDELAAVLARQGDWLAVRKLAAQRYWADVAAAGRKRFDEAIKHCSTQQCRDNAVLLKGPHYQYTPVSGGAWRNGTRGDGLWVPEAQGNTGQALARFNQRFGTDLKGIPYAGGRPDFSAVTVKTPTGTPALVEIAQTGKSIDFKNADAALFAATGETQKSLETRLGMPLTWHHVEDSVTMQLVPRGLHGASHQLGHAGGASLITNPEY